MKPYKYGLQPKQMGQTQAPPIGSAGFPMHQKKNENINGIGGIYNPHAPLVPIQADNHHAQMPHYRHPHSQMQMNHPSLIPAQINPAMQQFSSNPPYQYQQINQQNTPTFSYRNPPRNPPLYQTHNPPPLPKKHSTLVNNYPIRRKALRRKNKIKRRLLNNLDHESQRKLWKLQERTRKTRTQAEVELYKNLCQERKRIRANHPRTQPHAHKRDLISKCILKLDDFVGLVSEYNGLKSSKGVITKIKSETKFVAYIQKLCNFLREPRFMPLCIWKRVSQNLVKLAGIAKTPEGAYLKDQLLLKELYYAAYERQNREHPDRSFQLPQADFSPFKKRPQKLPKVEVCKKWFDPNNYSRRTIYKRKIGKRKRSIKTLCGCRFTQPLSFPETLKSRHARPCINFNWSQCKAGDNCANPHKCSGCGSKSHGAKFCTKVSMEFNWKYEKNNIIPKAYQNRSINRDPKCLGCGSTKHGAKKCQHLLPMIKDLYCESFNGRFRPGLSIRKKNKKELYKYYKRRKELQRKLKKNV